MSNKNKNIDIIYVIFNNYEEILKSLSSLNKVIDSQININIFIIDNSTSYIFKERQKSLKSFCKKLKEKNIFGIIKYVCNEKNIGFGKACNQGANISKSEKILFLNCDTIFTKKNTLIDLYNQCNKDNVIVGPLIKNINNQEEESYFSFAPRSIILKPLKTLMHIKSIKNKYLNNKLLDLNYKKFHQKNLDKTKYVDWLSGCCLLVERDFFESINGFDDSYFLYFEDVDLCRKAREKNKNVIYYPLTEIIHNAQYESKKSKGIIRSILFNKASRYHIISWLIYLFNWRSDFYLLILKNLNIKYKILYKRLSFGRFEDIDQTKITKK